MNDIQDIIVIMLICWLNVAVILLWNRVCYIPASIKTSQLTVGQYSSEGDGEGEADDNISEDKTPVEKYITMIHF